jgi:hypothetical protein
MNQGETKGHESQTFFGPFGDHKNEPWLNNQSDETKQSINNYVQGNWMLFRLWLIVANLVLSFIGYQVSVDQFKFVSVSCIKIESKVFLDVDAEILDSALFLNQLTVNESESIITLKFRKRFVTPRTKTFIDRIVVSTSAMKSVEPIPLLSAAWHKTRVNLGPLSGQFYTFKIVGFEGERVIGHCSLWFQKNIYLQLIDDISTNLVSLATLYMVSIVLGNF